LTKRYHTEKHNTTINPIRGDPSTTTKGQQPEMAKTYRPPKRHQKRSREGREQLPTYWGSVCGPAGWLSRQRALDKI